jgi:hypothetical protein
MAVSAAALTVLISCGGSKSGTGPSPVLSPSISSLSPKTGSTHGGTTVTISGANFRTGIAVTIGGAAATGVVVGSATTLTAITPAHTAGTVDVVVSVDDRSATLPGSFTYLVPANEPNGPPTIQSLTIKGSRANEPSDFADLGEEVTVSAQVQDAETPADRLTYNWNASSGTITGTGQTVTWKAPTDVKTPTTATISLEVVERYQAVDDSGAEVTRENKVDESEKVDIHDSEREVGGMAVNFLKRFSDSSVSVNVVMQDFMDCAGATEERTEVDDNRKNFTINSSTVGSATVTVNFGGTCVGKGTRPGDACASVPVEWRSTRKSDGVKVVSKGTDYLTAFYRSHRWWLCDSNFEGTNTPSGVTFMR